MAISFSWNNINGGSSAQSIASMLQNQDKLGWGGALNKLGSSLLNYRENELKRALEANKTLADTTYKKGMLDYYNKSNDIHSRQLDLNYAMKQKEFEHELALQEMKNKNALEVASMYASMKGGGGGGSIPGSNGNNGASSLGKNFANGTNRMNQANQNDNQRKSATGIGQNIVSHAAQTLIPNNNIHYMDMSGLYGH